MATQADQAADQLQQSVDRFVQCVDAHRDVYARLRDLEKQAAGNPWNEDLCDLRRRLPDTTLRRLLPALPRDLFCIQDNNEIAPRLREAAFNWKVSRKRLLFDIGFDSAQQGQPFFQELVHLSSTSLD